MFFQAGAPVVRLSTSETDLDMSGNLIGKVALVTGGASGVGEATARLLQAQGASVAISDINVSAGEQLAAELGEQAMFIRHDVTDEQDWAAAMAAVTSRFGKLDILINNAGILMPGTIESANLKQFQRLMQVNAESCFLGCQHGVVAMKEKGGAIINMASIASWLPMDDYLAYSASKAAVAAISRNSALHCRKKGYPVRINSVHPDGIYTPMMKAALPAGVTAEMVLHNAQTNPAGRAYLPERIAQLILFLASDASSVISGSELHADNAVMGMGL